MAKKRKKSRLRRSEARAAWGFIIPSLLGIAILVLVPFGEAIRRTLLPHVRDIELRIRFNVPRSLLTDNATHEILRIIRELAVNGISHGGAKAIQVAGGVDGGRLLFSVRDDGAGFDPDTAPGVLQGHFGLEGVRERLRQLKGSLVFERMPGGGMRATVAIPLPGRKP